MCFSSAKSSDQLSHVHNSSLPVAPVETCKLWARAARLPYPPAQPRYHLSRVDDECVEAGRVIRAAKSYTDVLAVRGALRKRKCTSRNETYNATYGEIIRRASRRITSIDLASPTLFIPLVPFPFLSDFFYITVWPSSRYSRRSEMFHVARDSSLVFTGCRSIWLCTWERSFDSRYDYASCIFIFISSIWLIIDQDIFRENFPVF